MAVTIQLRGDTAANWILNNPILAERELAVETDTWLYKIGDGITTWNDLPYRYLRTLDEADVLVLNNQSVVPTPPSTNKVNLFGRDIAGRMMFRQQGPSGLSTPLQPSFFQNFIVMINTNTTTTLTSIGDAVGGTNIASGTISHPAPTELYGRMANIVSPATAGDRAATGTTNLLFTRGSVSNSGGFFFNARIAFPDSSYDRTTASTGSRFWCGLSDQLNNAYATDNPAGNRIMVSRISSDTLTESTFWISTRNGTDSDRVNTGLVFLPQCVYDIFLFCPPHGNNIGWRIDNITTNESVSGSVDQFLPTNTLYMRPQLCLQTINAVARNIRLQRIYCESDR